MKKLTIITINYNNALGLQKTMESVLSQTSTNFEYIVIDGASTDGSVDIIETFQLFNFPTFSYVSEPDSGIYNAMNKGIRMAKGEYVQFLNSGDVLAAADVTERMLSTLSLLNAKGSEGALILYGNMMKPLPKRTIKDCSFAGKKPTMLDFYTGTLNHSPTYIKKSLFDIYGLYDENLKIVSDWKWYLQVIILNNELPVYMNIDVTVFDMNGISNSNSQLEEVERRAVLEALIPLQILVDYDRWVFSINQMKRINRYWLIKKGFWFIERVLFKWEKHMNSKSS